MVNEGVEELSGNPIQGHGDLPRGPDVGFWKNSKAAQWGLSIRFLTGEPRLTRGGQPGRVSLAIRTENKGATLISEIAEILARLGAK